MQTAETQPVRLLRSKLLNPGRWMSYLSHIDLSWCNLISQNGIILILKITGLGWWVTGILIIIPGVVHLPRPVTRHLEVISLLFFVPCGGHFKKFFNFIFFNLFCKVHKCWLKDALLWPLSSAGVQGCLVNFYLFIFPP